MTSEEDTPHLPGHFPFRSPTPPPPPMPSYHPFSRRRTIYTRTNGPFPRTNWTGQPPCLLRIARCSTRSLDRIEYAARIASQGWALLADRGKLHLVNPVMYRLAVLDKVFEL